MDYDYFCRGLIFIVLGLVIVGYIFYRRKKEKKYNDLKGFVGGIGAIIFGLYLIFEALTNQF